MVSLQVDLYSISLFCRHIQHGGYAVRVSGMGGVPCLLVATMVLCASSHSSKSFRVLRQRGFRNYPFSRASELSEKREKSMFFVLSSWAELHSAPVISRTPPRPARVSGVEEPVDFLIQRQVVSDLTHLHTLPLSLVVSISNSTCFAIVPTVSLLT